MNHIKGKPFFIAVAPFEQPFFYEQTSQAITQVLYGYKKAKYKTVNNERIILGHEYIDFVEKDNGSEVPLGFFANNQMENIAGVIYSNCATFGKIRALTKEIDKRDMYFTFSRFNKDGLDPFVGTVRKTDYFETLEDGIQIFLNPFYNMKFLMILLIYFKL